MKFLATTLFTISLVLGACGDDRNLFEIDPNKKLSELNDSEVQTLCDYQEFYVNETDRHKVTCYGTAYEANNDETICEPAAMMCVENDEFFDADCDNQTFADSTIASCSTTPTVADLQKCLLADAEFFSDLADRVTCGNIANESMALPDDCQLIGVECPEFFGTASGAESLLGFKSRFDRFRTTTHKR